MTADEIFGHYGWENTFMIDMHSKFYEVRLIQLGKAKLAFYNVYFHRGWKLNLCQISADAKKN